MRELLLATILLSAGLAGCLADESGPDPPPAAPDEGGGSENGVDRNIIVDIEAMPCPEGYNNSHSGGGFGEDEVRDDDVCLGYNGQIPGPTWVFEKDQHVEIELRHKVAETIEDMDVDPELGERLSQARYSLHRHGLSLDACNDGVAKIEGTEICDSTVGPGETVTYEFNTSFAGDWHYHDHGLSFDGEAAQGPILGHEAEERGLWGSFVVLDEGETTDHVVDMHVLDTGINGGLGVQETVTEGERFDLLAVGLGMRSALDTVTLEDPNGNTIGEKLIGPGVSRGLTVEEAKPGAYSWRVVTKGPATDREPRTYEGTIEVEPADKSNESGSDASDEGSADAAGAQLIAPGAAGQTPLSRQTADRVFAIDFSFPTASERGSLSQTLGGPPGGLPLLEAYAGEQLRFEVVNPQRAPNPGPHTFHLHGHPWQHPETGETIDAEPMHGGDRHNFTVRAGLGEGHTGDWYYHCHMGIDVGPMWSVLRVYENTMDVDGPLDDFTVTVEDEDGRPIEDASLTVRWNPNAPADPTLASADDGRPIPAAVTETAPGVYDVEADVPDGVAGELVIESEHATGESLLRLTVAPDGAYEENRDVGLDVDDGREGVSFDLPAEITLDHAEERHRHDGGR